VSATRLVFGLGTGRCGTGSLASLLDAQPGAAVTHEAAPVLPWVVDEGELARRLADLRARGGVIAGDVALSYLPYAERLLDECEETRLVVLRRDRAETVRSYERLAGGRNHFAGHARGDWRADPEWDRCYPDYEGLDLRAALCRYWDEYYERAADLVTRHPDRVLLVDVPAALSTESGVRRILDHAGVPRCDQVIRTDIHENRGPDLTGRVKRAVAHRLRRHRRDDIQD
jgi:hypothetical protein